jgi:hypothetical protein
MKMKACFVNCFVGMVGLYLQKCERELIADITNVKHLIIVL